MINENNLMCLNIIYINLHLFFGVIVVSVSFNKIN